MLWLQILNLLAFIVTLVANGLANALPFNGQTTGEVSDKIPVLFTPAGYVFSIWSVIYLGLAAFAVYQVLPAQRDGEMLRRIGYWFLLNSVCNSLWLLAWHYERFGTSLMLMLGILVSLIAIYLRLDIGLGDAPRTERLLVHLPFGIYLGWISVATIANFSAVLYTAGWTGFGVPEEIWTIVMMLAAAGLALGMLRFRGSVAYPLVIIWALVGIMVRQMDTLAVALPAVVLALALAVATTLGAVRDARAPGSRSKVPDSQIGQSISGRPDGRDGGQA